MKNKLGIFTALILSLVIAGSAFAMPETVSGKKLVTANAKVSKTANTKKRRHHRHRKLRKMKKTTTTTTTTTPKKNK